MATETAGATFPFELVSPERLLVSAEVRSVVVPGSEGDFEVLKQHAPFLAMLRPGILRVTGAGGERQAIFVRAGFADVNGAGLTILAEEAVPVEQLKPDQIAEAVATAEKNLADLKDPAQRSEAERMIAALRDVQTSLRAG
ncbi:MAG TPA: F0F1 ATP synthase subunit epsilon [Kaistia sp.]|nr:F0F1 ATP synthase subunit epsilon [Kaistia sp.]